MLDEFRSTHITWDKATSRIYSPVTANASDENGRKLVVQIVNSGQVEDLTGAALHLYWETRDKAHDGLDVFKAVDLEKGEFELSYTTGMLSNKGVLNANLVLIDTVGRVVSERFKITVTEGIDNDAIQSENSFSSLTQALIDIGNLEQNYAPRLNDLTAQLAQKANKLEVRKKNIPITLNDADTELLAAIAGGDETSFNVFSVPKNYSVTPEKHFDAVLSKNRFNKDTAIIGYYVNAGVGNLLPNANYFAAELPVNPNTTYERTYADQMSFHKMDGAYIGTTPTNDKSFVTPALCHIIKVSAPLSQLENFMVVEGELTDDDYDGFYYGLKYLKHVDPDMKNNLDTVSEKTQYLTKRQIGYFEDVLRQLRNPFTRTQLKLIGDSLLAGVGGTGYSPTGEQIGATSYKANVPTAYCWANLLRNNILEHFNKENLVEMNHPGITNGITQGNFRKEQNALLKWRLVSPNTNAEQSIKFDFFGEHFSVFYSKSAGSGILEIWVDGEWFADLDTYGVASYQNEAEYTGLSMDNHTVEIKQTNRKNENSSFTSIYLEGVKVPKTVEVKNWGISGITSDFLHSNIDSLVEPIDDIVFVQIGTNDRTLLSSSITKTNVREIVNYIKRQNKQVILMSANPSSISGDNLPNIKFKTYDVDVAIGDVANEFDMPYISNYNHFISYTDLKGISVESLLPDGLHPNDDGQDVYYLNIIRSIGLPIMREDNNV